MKSKKPWIREVQETLGCPDCYWCDESALGSKRGCCRKPGGAQADNSGKCLDRK